jgi:hypothetical protein
MTRSLTRKILAYIALILASFYIPVTPAAAFNPTFFAMNTNPPDVTALDRLEDTPTTMLLFWTSGGGTTSAFRIAYKAGASAPASCFSGTQISEATIGSATNYIVTGLTANTLYSFRVCAVAIGGVPAPGITTSLTTPVTQPIFRSTGFGSTTAKATGAANAMTISGSIITLTTGLAANIGLGDAIQYSSANNATMDNIAFIHGRLSATQYLIKKASGATPTAVTANTTWSLFRAYTSLLNARNGTENTGIAAAVQNFDSWAGGANLTALSATWYIECYADATDTSAYINIAGWTTSANNKLYITTPWETRHVGTRQRHQGTWSSTYFTATVIDNNVIEVDNNYVVIEGLQLQSTLSAGSFMAPITIGASAQLPVNSVTEINENILLSINSSAAYGDINGIFANWVNSGTKIYATNNIVICSGAVGKECNTAIRGAYNNANTVNWTGYLYNNTVVGNWYYGIDYSNSGSGTITAYSKNNIVQGTKFQSYLAVVWGTGTGYNVSGNTFTTGAGTDKASATVSFVAPGSNNYHLNAGDSVAKDAGTDLSADGNYPVTMDVDSTPRTGTWDIGADGL